jgi:multisubunit Na+/H+ antiporter MnhG subunit
MLRDVVIDVLVALCVVTTALSCAGVLVMRTPLQRLHYLGPLAIVSPVLLGVAVAIARNTYSGASLKALVIAFVVALFAPVLSHQMGQMADARHDSP